MSGTLKKAVQGESEKELIKYLDFSQSDKIDPEQYDLIEKALLGTWHSQHEDLVNTIYLENIKDDRFVEPILKIALKREVFRWYDDEIRINSKKVCARFESN